MPIANEAEVERARHLVMRYGWNATAYQIVNPGIAHWYSARGDAVVGYVPFAGTWVVAGAPVCARERLGDVVAELEAYCASRDLEVCYFGAEGRLESVLDGSGRHSLVVLGAQPAWDPRHWPDIVGSHASLRAQLNRARNKGVVVAEMTAPDGETQAALQRVLREWLATRGLPALHFLVEPETLGRLFDRRLFVARRHGEVVGFLVASPVPQRNGWLVEQIIRGAAAANGTNELMVDAAMRALAAGGSTYVTLGLSPLSPHADYSHAPNPEWLRLVLRWVRAHGRRFYNFEGLDRFKSKFAPDDWEPVYAIYARPRFTIGALRAIAGAFSGCAPELTVLRALWRGAVQELRWLWRRFHGRHD